MIPSNLFPRAAMRIASAACLAIGALAVASPAAQAQTSVGYSALHSFADASEGSSPSLGLKRFSDGNLYGITFQGGDANGQAQGTFYRIAPDGSNFTVLHVFNGGAAGLAPTGFIQASDGNIYGATRVGGANAVGTFYRMALDGSGFTVIYDCVDDEVNATLPNGLTQAADGNFYGTSNGGGDIDNGTVFRLTPAGGITTLHSFSGTDGRNARDVLVIGDDGNLYGTTPDGGRNVDDPGNTAGTFFRVTTAGDFATLHVFTKQEATGSVLPITAGPDGNFYGVSPQGGGASFGEPGDGTILRIAKSGATTVLHKFSSTVDDRLPFAQLTLGSDGNLYGGNDGEASVAFPGDDQDKNGRLFRISPSGIFESLFQFPQGSAVGSGPTGPMVEISPGVFIGAAVKGGASNDGVIFQLAVSGPIVGTGGGGGGGGGTLPTITLDVLQSRATVSEPGVFLLTRTGDDLSAAVSVAYSVAGSAKGGNDYAALKGVKTIKAGKDTAKIKVNVLRRPGVGVKKTVVLTLESSDAYTVGTDGKLKVKIVR